MRSTANGGLQRLLQIFDEVEALGIAEVGKIDEQIRDRGFEILIGIEAAGGDRLAGRIGVIPVEGLGHERSPEMRTARR